jgi:hypothetical protein
MEPCCRCERRRVACANKCAHFRRTSWLTLQPSRSLEFHRPLPLLSEARNTLAAIDSAGIDALVDRRPRHHQRRLKVLRAVIELWQQVKMQIDHRPDSQKPIVGRHLRRARNMARAWSASTSVRRRSRPAARSTDDIFAAGPPRDFRSIDGRCL